MIADRHDSLLEAPMAKRCAATLLGIGIGVIAGAAITAALSAAPQTAAQQPSAQTPQAGRGPAEPPAPCGPQGQLPANLAKNVDAKSRCFEVRIYTVDQGRVGTGN